LSRVLTLIYPKGLLATRATGFVTTPMVWGGGVDHQGRPKAMGEADFQGLFISNLVKSVGGGSATRELIREMVAGDTLIELEVPEDLRPPRSKASLQSLASSGTDPDAFFNRVREVQKAQESGQG